MTDYQKHNSDGLTDMADIVESEGTPSQRHIARVPWWMWLIIVACALPGIAYPFMLKLLASPNPMIRVLTWLYPAYVLFSAFLAWQCYGRRTVMTWILLILLLLSHACFYFLSFYRF